MSERHVVEKKSVQIRSEARKIRQGTGKEVRDRPGMDA